MDTDTGPGPISGQLIPLKTKDEVRAGLLTQEVYVVEVSSRHANDVKDIIHEALPDFKSSEINHLRRVVQSKFLPDRLRNQFPPPARIARGENEQESCPNISLEATSIPLPPSPTGSGIQEDSSPILLSPSLSPLPLPPAGAETTHVAEINLEDLVRYFVLCPTRYIQHAELFNLLRSRHPFSTQPMPPRLLYATVPTLAPTSQQQADHWSETYWPIAYKNTNPYGPHPSLVSRNAAELETKAGDWLALAVQAGREMSNVGFGEEIGCVVVDSSRQPPEAVAVAGDGRWRSPMDGTPTAHEDCGNVMAHAVVRAIGLVAKKRLRAKGLNPTTDDLKAYADEPLTAIEKVCYEAQNVDPEGYLCTGMDIYMTHEPCNMCSMAIVHSRFKRAVFINRAPLTGYMTADTVGNAQHPGKGLERGLFWLPAQLNWKFLVWEYQSEDPNAQSSIDDTQHV